MPSDLPSVEVKPTREFRRNLRALAKKYRNIRSDVQALVERLQAGELLGDPLPGFEYSVYKRTAISRKAKALAIGSFTTFKRLRSYS